MKIKSSSRHAGTVNYGVRKSQSFQVERFTPGPLKLPQDSNVSVEKVIQPSQSQLRPSKSKATRIISYGMRRPNDKRARVRAKCSNC